MPLPEDGRGKTTVVSPVSPAFLRSFLAVRDAVRGVRPLPVVLPVSQEWRRAIGPPVRQRHVRVLVFDQHDSKQIRALKWKQAAEALIVPLVVGAAALAAAATISEAIAATTAAASFSTVGQQKQQQ